MVTTCITHSSDPSEPVQKTRADRVRVSCVLKTLKLGAIGLVISLLAGCQTAPPLPLAGNPFAPVEPPQLALGDTYVYRLSDGYGNKPPGQVSYRVDRIEADRIVMLVDPNTRIEGGARIESYTRDGNWLRHPLINHDEPVLYEFNTPYPAYVAPFAPNQSWSTRVTATNPSQGRRSVRVDGKVLGAERIRVPAGEFDTIKIRRLVYAGDTDYRTETQITEIDWYAPVLGRAVRTERQGQWREYRSCDNFFFCDNTKRSDWHVYELVSYPAPGR